MSGGRTGPAPHGLLGCQAHAGVVRSRHVPGRSSLWSVFMDIWNAGPQPPCLQDSACEAPLPAAEAARG